MKIDDSEYFTTIRRAWKGGRPIVPIVGAGASADSGFPPLASVVRYIAKLSCYLTHRLYLPPSQSSHLFRPNVREFSERPDKFVSIFGWPDRFQLNASLRSRLGQLPKDTLPRREWEQDPRFESKGLMEMALCRTLDDLASKINPGGYWHLNNYLTSKVGNVIQQASSWPKEFRDAVQQLKEPTGVQSFRYQVVGDWKPLLRHITWYQPELVDALFARLARNRTPGTAHTLIAHLSHLLRIRALFTFNFDPFIEAALARENVPHRIFAMEHGNELPSRHHLDDSVSVIKMHGSTHNILVDERVDYRVSDRYKQQFLSLIGESPLLLVIGCSGNDRRLVDLVCDVMADSPKANVIWMHHSKRFDVPYVLQGHPRVCHYATYDLGQSFQRLFESLTERLPNSAAPYVAHINRPTLPGPTGTALSDGADSVQKACVTLFLPPQDVSPEFPSSHRSFMHALAAVEQGYTSITVDLEEHHTLEQVVAEIIDQVRRADTALPPFITSGEVPGDLSASNDYAQKAADRVIGALRRSRYALCISGIDAFPFRPTTHHGVTSSFGEAAEAKYKQLFEFLKRLASGLENGWTDGDSFLMLAYENPYRRHCRDPGEAASVNSVRTLLESEIQKCIPKRKAIVVKTDSVQLHTIFAAERENSKACFDARNLLYIPPEFSTKEQGELRSREDCGLSLNAWHAIVAVIACHRRTRTKIGVRHLIRDIFAGRNELELSAAEILMQLETGKLPLWMSWTKEEGLWLDRPARDWIYDFNTRATTQAELSNHSGRTLGLCQALLGAIFHDRVARNYYLNLFLPSRDSFFFLEYVYHRMSTLRYLAQLQAQFSLPSTIEVFRDANRSEVVFLDDKGRPATPNQIEFYSDGSDWRSLFASFRTSKDSEEFAKAVGDSIQTIRRRCLRGLSQTWVRSESYIRRTLPPGQVVTWCENLLEYNLGVGSISDGVLSSSDRTSAFHRSLVNSLLGSSDAIVASVRAREDSISGERYELVDALKNTLFRAMYAHASYDKLLKLNWLLPSDDGTLNPKASSDSLHWQLNRRVASLWSVLSKGGMDSKRTESGELPMLKRLKNDANAMRDNPGEWRANAEARLRVFYLEAEASLTMHLGDDDRTPPFTFNAVSQPDSGELKSQIRLRDDRLTVLHAQLSEFCALETSLLSAIEEAREEYASADGKMYNPILEPTSDRGLFIPYRALFQIQLGRRHLCAARTRSRIARTTVERARFRSVLGKELPERAFRAAAVQMKEARKDLTAAYRDLAYAKQGIGSENSALLAIADLCCADVAIEGSDLELAWLYRKDWASGESFLSRSQAKLNTASGYLTRCLSQLVQGPRLVLLWRAFHMTQAKYHMRRIATIAEEVTCRYKSGMTSLVEKYMAPKIGELARRVRLAILGIRFGMDYSLGDDAAYFRERFSRLWAQLGAISLYAATVMARSANMMANSLMDTLLSAWVDINRSEGMFARLTEHGGTDGSDAGKLELNMLSALRNAIAEPMNQMTIDWEDVCNIGGLLWMRDRVWVDYTEPFAKLLQLDAFELR